MTLLPVSSSREGTIMLMTVEQAKKVWCPHAMVVQTDVPTVSYNRHVTVKDGFIVKGGDALPHGSFCLANHCAAWRWKNNPELAEIDLVTGDIEQRTGYCGMAGPLCS